MTPKLPPKLGILLHGDRIVNRVVNLYFSKQARVIGLPKNGFEPKHGHSDAPKKGNK